MPPAAAIAGAAVVGAGASIIGANKAANAQRDAANQANATQQAMYNQTRNDLAPFRSAGAYGTNLLTSRMNELTTPFSMTQAQLEQTPGYQFTLSQGLKAVNNAMGARGLLNSGAVMRGAADYATGLADNTYMNQFNANQTQNQNIFNKLYGLSSLGENAAAQTGAMGTQTAAGQAQNTIGAGNASAAATMAGVNGISNAANGIGSYFMTNNLLSRMNGANAGLYANGMTPSQVRLANM